jgi:hypothetical protein
MELVTTVVVVVNTSLSIVVISEVTTLVEVVIGQYTRSVVVPQ